MTTTPTDTSIFTPTKLVRIQLLKLNPNTWHDVDPAVRQASCQLCKGLANDTCVMSPLPFDKHRANRARDSRMTRASHRPCRLANIVLIVQGTHARHVSDVSLPFGKHCDDCAGRRRAEAAKVHSRVPPAVQQGTF